MRSEITTSHSLPALRIACYLIFAILIADRIEYLVMSQDGLSTWLAVCAAGLLVLYSIGRKSMLYIESFLIFAIILLTVIIRLSATSQDADGLHKYADRAEKVRLTGIVKTDPDKTSARVRFVLESRTVDVTPDSSFAARGNVMVTLRDKGVIPVAYGDSLALSGRLRLPTGARNPGEFDYARYLKLRSVGTTMSIYRADRTTILARACGNPFMSRFIYPIKHYIIETADSTLSFVPAGILKALLVGVRSDIPAEVIEAFADSGTIHILSLSGLHVGFVVLLLFGLFRFLRLNLKIRIVLILFCLSVYCCMTDFKPSIVRASVMTAIILGGMLLQRRTEILNSLLVALILILFASPRALFDLGLQLSFLAVWGIVSIYSRLEAWCVKRKLLCKVRWNLYDKAVSLLLVSIAAQIATLPIVAHYFGKFPVTALVANILVVPLATVAVYLGFVTLGAGFFSVHAAQWYANVNQWVIKAMTTIAETAVDLPLAGVQNVHFGALEIFLYYSALAAAAFWSYGRIRKYTLIGILLLFNIVGWRPLYSPEPTMTVAFLDVGQGDCVLIRTPGGRTILVDAGDRTPNFDYGSRIIAPLLRHWNISRIDWLIMSHPDKDHIGGVNSILKEFACGSVVHSGQTASSRTYKSIMSTIRRRNVNDLRLRAGDVLDIENEIRLYFLHPSAEFVSDSGAAPFNPNNGSLVAKLQFREVDILLPGDIEFEGLERLERFQAVLKSDILKISHHGSFNGTTPQFLSWVQPQYAVISAGKFNKFGHPSPGVVRMLESCGASVMRTSLRGAVIFETNGLTISTLPWN